MPALDWITIRGFKSIANIERLELRPINVLVGANGSGKSNFIGAFAFLHAVREGRLKEFVRRNGGADNILHFGSKRTKELFIHIAFEDELNQYEINLGPSSDDGLYPISELAMYWTKGRYDHPRKIRLSAEDGEAGISREQQGPIGRYVRNHLDRWRIYHFHDTSPSSPIKRTADVNDNRFLRPDGSNLAAFLYYLRVKQEDSYREICSAVQQVAPFFDDFALQPQALNEDKIRLEWRHRGSDAYFDASSLSDGSLRFIALATLLLQPEELRPSVILLDEPELGLHPSAIDLLAALIRHASKKTQIILSTQSPILLDQFSPEDVIVADRKAGRTELTRLEGESLKVWLEEYSLGQLWEKNQLGGRPAAQRSEDVASP